MAVEGATQALVAAFFFGIVLNAASAALVLYLRGYGLAAVFRDSQRLVLVLFLLSAALWAQVDFITILLDITTSPTSCQVGIIFSTIFDQFARFSIEQFLLWAMHNNNGAKLSIMQLIPQVLVLGRFLAGAVFIGFTRPQTDTFCVATTSALPVGILVTALDGVILLLLIVRAYSAGGVAKENRKDKGVDADRARALMSIILGLVFWTGTSVPLLLGIKTLALATRTALPAGGLLVVIVFVAGGAQSLNVSRATGSRPPEAPSPRRINISRDISTSDTDYPPTRFEDLKEAAIRSSTTFVNPREAPRVKDETSIGFNFGSETVIQGGPMPPLPTSIVPASDLVRKLDRSASHKKNLFGVANGKMAIGHPILQENAGQNPLSKIAVMDLQEAAIADRERRARMYEEDNAVANRSARPSVSMAPEEVLKRGVSLKRKEVASVSIRESVFPGYLQAEDGAVGLTTSAQLSPGGEDTRRRSPRQSLQEEPVPQRQEEPVWAAEPVRSRSESPQNRPLTIQQPLLKTNIRPSRMLPPSPKTPPPEPTKTPLQRRPTIGLPSNPRARGLKIAEESGSQHRTILFVNNIEYNDPLAVQAIIKTAGNPSTKPDSVTEGMGRSSSVVNRPRPIPRKAADSPAQSPALSHRRSKSGGSLIGRKSFLAPSPGSPTRLPPLPSLPRSAAVSGRPQPNDTKSMTFEEKVTLLFPSPPNANAAKRRSSVPDVPRIPASYLDMDSSPSEPYDRQRSNRTTKTSFRTESVLEVDEIPRLSGRMAVNTTNEAGSSWLRAFGDEDDGSMRNKAPAKQASGKRGSSPIIPGVPVRASAWTETTYDRSEDDATNWSAMNSPELAVGVPVMQRLGLPSSIQMPTRPDLRGSQLSFADNRSRETLPIMLDTSTVQEEAGVPGPTVSEVEVVATPELPTWHRRVGDECPTFSDRKEKTKLRKMPPPAPLSLNTTSTMKMLAIQVEPSPLESPGQAIQQIRSQLKKLEELEQATPQSASRRLALLEDLEREMGQQAEHWQEIKHDMGRDSMSSMQTASPTGRNSRHESVASTTNVARESIRQSIGADRRASRLTRIRNNGNSRVPEAPVRNSVSPQLSKWQKRLTEAQMDYMDAQLLRGSNVNFMQLSRAQLASPTPPDSDHSEAEVSPLPSPSAELPVEQPLQAYTKAPLLWTPALKESDAATNLLWTHVVKPIPKLEAPLPGLSVRPAQRKELAPLQIQSSQLWRKPYNTANRSASGLWRPVWASAAPPAAPLTRTPSKSGSTSQKPPRPVTQRPPRRNKRVTLLPDILENPEPLPDKRGTLGIFQFPWGEKSDTASVQARPSMYMAMPGTMTSGGPSLGAGMGARSKQPEPTEYSSSFFDDYDDENEMDSDDEDSDDSFDETTLWEIASLLKADSVPSRDSLLPPPSDSVVDDYMDELDPDEEGQSSRKQSIVIGLAEPQELFAEQQRDSATIESTTLLMLEDAIESKTPPKPVARVGLPANPKASLNRQTSHTTSPAAPEVAPVSEVPRQTAEAWRAETAREQGSAGLWYPPSQANKSSLGGLFAPESSRPGYRGSSEEPAAKYMSRKPRPTEQRPLERLTSTKLWASEDAVRQSERNWILGARIKRQENRIERPQAGLSDWKSALNEAITASYSHTKKLKRVVATPAQWRAALEEAISLSDRAPAFDPAVRHPVFAASSLVTRSEWFHPAAAGYTYDVSIVHPVFFGSLAITCPEDAVHPAISAYAAKKLRRQRSKQGRSSDSRSPSPSPSQTRSRRKDEISAQIRALEQQEGGSEGEVYTSSDAPPRIPASPEREIPNTAIQAQIEALEQERLFVERAAKEEYLRRTTMTAAVAEPVVAMLAEEVMPAGADTVQDLQRHLSRQIRQSLVFAAAGAVTIKAEPEPTAVPRSGVASSNKAVSVSTTASPGKDPNDKGKQLLWGPTPGLVAGVSPTGMWSATTTTTTGQVSSIIPGAEEDALAASQRARRRRVMQKKQRRQEILAQIAAVESGVNPFVDFAGMGLWVYGRRNREETVVARQRDWLHSVCLRKTRGVILRY